MNRLCLLGMVAATACGRTEPQDVCDPRGRQLLLFDSFESDAGLAALSDSSCGTRDARGVTVTSIWRGFRCCVDVSTP